MAADPGCRGIDGEEGEGSVGFSDSSGSAELAEDGVDCTVSFDDVDGGDDGGGCGEEDAPGREVGFRAREVNISSLSRNERRRMTLTREELVNGRLGKMVDWRNERFVLLRTSNGVRQISSGFSLAFTVAGGDLSF